MLPLLVTECRLRTRESPAPPEGLVGGARQTACLVTRSATHAGLSVPPSRSIVTRSTVWARRGSALRDSCATCINPLDVDRRDVSRERLSAGRFRTADQCVLASVDREYVRAAGDELRRGRRAKCGVSAGHDHGPTTEVVRDVRG